MKRILALVAVLATAAPVAAVGVYVLAPNGGGLGAVAAQAPLSYASAEPAGEVQDPADAQPDATVREFRSGARYATVGEVAVLQVDPDARLNPGESLVGYRDEGPVGAGVPDAGDCGDLIHNLAVLRVLSIDGDRALARVVRVYGSFATGDSVRSRAARRRAYGRLLRRVAPKGAAPVGVVVGVIPPKLWAGAGEVVCLNVGWRAGALPGVRLKVTSHPNAEAAGFGPDDESSRQPASPPGPLPDPEDPPRELPNGTIGMVEVVNASAQACVARVLDCRSPVQLGDRVSRP